MLRMSIRRLISMCITVNIRPQWIYAHAKVSEGNLPRKQQRTRQRYGTTVTERAAKIRYARRVRLPNAVIQTKAQTENALLITRNTRDFPDDDPGFARRTGFDTPMRSHAGVRGNDQTLSMRLSGTIYSF